MNEINAEFVQGTQGKLFRLSRCPNYIQGHVVYVPPLFEQANKSRHMLTRSALGFNQQGFESIVVDHYGTGDSEGELNEASLLLWQQDIIAQLNEIKSRSDQPIILFVSLSAALLLNNDMLALVDALVLVQPEFNGKRFIQQFKRLALAESLNKLEGIAKSPLVVNDEITIAGYAMQKQLFDNLNQCNINNLTSMKLPCCLLEWQPPQESLSAARAKQYQKITTVFNTQLYAIDDIKYWQSTELEIAKELLATEQQAIMHLLSAIAEINAC